MFIYGETNPLKLRLFINDIMPSNNVVQIRPLKESDVQLLKDNFVINDPTSIEYTCLDSRLHSIIPKTGDIDESIRLMNLKEEICLIAWKNKIAVGWIHLRWEGDHDLHRIIADNPLARDFVNIPALYDFWVMETHRSNGIGRKLAQEAEKYTRMKKFSKIGLVVDTFNTRAKYFYLSLRFQDVGIGEFETHGTYEKNGEKINFSHGPMIYLMKQL